MMVEVVGLFRQGARTLAALPVGVNGGSVVVGSGAVLVAEQQTRLVAVVSAVASAAACRDGVAAAGVAVTGLTAAAGQEHRDKSDHQEQGQEGANHSAGHHAGTDGFLQGFCRGDEGVRKEGGDMGGGEEERQKDVFTKLDTVLLPVV